MLIPLRTVAGRTARDTSTGAVRILLVGPYDPHGGEFTFLAPPLGVWRLTGVLEHHDIPVQVFDPNCCSSSPEEAFAEILGSRHWDVIGFSTTGMTLQYDLSLVHLARRLQPHALLLAGGMEATFDPETVLQLAPLDLVVLGEGERPLVEIARRLQAGAALDDLSGVARRNPDGRIERRPQPALDQPSLKAAIFSTPYERMPYSQYWTRLEERYRIGQLPVKAEREARLAEIRSVRLITLNYCPMGCTFCSSTNFLTEGQGGQVAKIARLDEHECLAMIKRIVHAHPEVRTIVFQDDIFVFRQDRRILPLCEGIIQAKASGELPSSLQFISTNRIDAMTPQRIQALRHAGFRVLGFGVESFANGMLEEFNKAQIAPFIEPMLSAALEAGITPFLDMILSSPRCRLQDIAENVTAALRWITRGCEVGIYPYVIPFSGAAMARDPLLRPHTVYARRQIAGTGVSWHQPAKILPIDPIVRESVLAIERQFERWMTRLQDTEGHLPSRVRSLVWIASAIPILASHGCKVPPLEVAETALLTRFAPQGVTVKRDFPPSRRLRPPRGARPQLKLVRDGI